MINKPVTLYFEPLSLEVKFQKCLKLQIAIFRLSAEEAKGNKRAVKMDKTDPVKFTNPQEKIVFSRTLSLLTTLPFNSETQSYEGKEVDFEMALEIDGKKERMGRKVNLKEVLLSKSKTFKFAQESPLIALAYRAEVKLEDDKNQPEQGRKAEEPKKNTKIIRFEDDDVPNTKENMRAPREELEQARQQRTEKGRYKTVFFEPPQQQAKITDNYSEESQAKVMKKYKSLDKVAKSIDTEEREKADSRNANYQLESKVELYKQQYSKLQNKFASLEKSNQQLEKKLKERDAKISELTHKNEELQLRLQGELKTLKKEKEESKRQQTAKASQESQLVAQLRQEIRSYQIEVEKLRKTALNFQESTKHIATGSEQQIRALKERIQSLQRQNLEFSREAEFFSQSLKGKDQVIGDLKSKIYEMDKENLELQSTIQSLENKLLKKKEEYEFEIEDLQAKIDEMKEDNKNFKIATLKDIKDDNGPDYKKKVESLERQLEKKEELLRKMTEMKKENENERSSEINSLKKEVAALKEANQKLESSRHSRGSECNDIEIKIQLEKIKKELDTCRKNEKALLIEKGKLEANNRSLQDDIVKNKCAIANILNAVQETGNEKLITEVYNLTE